MQAYQQFAVYALRDKQPVFTDGTATQVLRTVDRNTRLNVIRREGPHYMVRILNQVAFVPVEDVSADRTAAPPAKFGDWATSGVRASSTPPPSNVTSIAGTAGRADFAQMGYIPASFMTRFWSFLIDAFTVAVICNIISGFLIAAFGLEPLRQTTVNGTETLVANWADYWTILMFTIPVAFTYYVAGLATMGTLGMVLMKIHVIDNDTGRTPDLGGCIVRVFVAWVSTIPFYLGYLWALWNNDRTWHDMAANTSVVQYR